jgi:hypothetical protein
MNLGFNLQEILNNLLFKLKYKWYLLILLIIVKTMLY